MSISEENRKALSEKQPQWQQTVGRIAERLRTLTRVNRQAELLDRRNSLSRRRSALVRKNMDAEVKIVDGILSAMAAELWGLSLPSGSDGKTVLVFGGTTKTQDTLDFIMWLRQADTLGIKLTEDDIRACLAFAAERESRILTAV